MRETHEAGMTALTRKKAWATRRKKYGPRGHSGPYCAPKPIYTAAWHLRMRSMEAMLIKLYRQGVLSEGQVSKATGLDRLSCRELAIAQADAEKPILNTATDNLRSNPYEILED